MTSQVLVRVLMAVSFSFLVACNGILGLDERPLDPAAGFGGTAGVGAASGSAGTSGTAGGSGTSSEGGSAGVSGAAGTDGTGGTGGTSAGSSGTAGASATGGTGGAGTAGSAGIAGTAGMGGAAGTAGMAGATVAPPRQLSPMSTSTVTQQQPTLRWTDVAGSTGTHIDICKDRACSQVEHSLDVTTQSTQPSAALVPGVHYWRLRSTESQEYGFTWQFNVGHRSTPVDTSWGTTLDLNGDGFADTVVGATGAEESYVYYGSAAGLPSSPSVTLSAPAGGYFGTSVASAGDVNGDGISDLVVGARDVANNAGTAHVYYGSSTGLPTSPSLTLSAPAGGLFGLSVACAGDVNGDGLADLVLGAYYVASSAGETYVYYGGTAGLSTSPSVTLSAPSGGYFGTSVASAGDIKGDGFADLVAGADEAASNAGAAYVYYGGSAGLPSSPSVTLTAPAGGSFGSSVASAEDVNGDGFADVVIGANHAGNDGSGEAYVYYGSGTGVHTTPSVTLPAPNGGYFGTSVASAGDVNGDGFGDLVVGADAVASNAGEAYVYYGNSISLPSTPSVTLHAPDGGYFGISLASAGDVNGVGFADMHMRAPSGGTTSKEAYVNYEEQRRLIVHSFGDLACTHPREFG